MDKMLYIRKEEIVRNRKPAEAQISRREVLLGERLKTMGG